jgi:crossover junction endonuclease MUS81
LKRSGIERIVYLVEGQLDRGVRDMDPSSIESALAAIQVVDRFFLKRTRNVRESIDYFVNMTEFLRLQYQSKQLCSFTMQKTEGDDTAAIAARHQKNQCADARCRYLISFEDYAELCRKTVPQTVGTTMIRMLMSIHGISLEKASVLAERFPTPHR